MQRLEFRAMGCRMLAVLDGQADLAASRLAQVPGWFEVWEQRLSRFRPDSELSRLNDRAGEPVVLSPVLWQVFRAALEAARLTNGLVQPTMLGILEDAGYDRPFESLLDDHDGPATPRESIEPSSWTDIRLERSSHSLTAPAGVRLDLGGIAKGWAADRAANRLGAIAPALVDGGGDIAVSGPMRDGRGWPIGVADPTTADGPLIETIQLRRGGVATSGRDYRRWRRNGTWQHHILDPRTGQPAQTDVVSATVIAPSAELAESAAKASLILGSREGLTWLEDRPHLGGLLVLDDRKILHSRRWRPAQRD